MRRTDTLSSRIAKTTLLLTAAAGTGCMFGPHDGTVVGDRWSSVHFWGAFPSSGEEIDIEARFQSTDTFYPVASAVSSGSPNHLFGIEWYLWATDRVLPWWAWKAGVSGHRAEVRARSNGTDLASFPQEGLNCILVAEGQGLSPTQARAECASWNTPGAFVYTADYQGLPDFVPTVPENYPTEFEHPHTEDNQGVASSDTHWLFTRNFTTPALVSIPLEDDLASFDTWSTAAAQPIPASLKNLGYDHYGDPDVHDGRIYVPVERNDKALPGVIAQFDADDLTFLGHAELDTNQTPWVAIDPASGHLYTSAFSDVEEVEVYAMILSENGALLELKRIGSRTLRAEGGAPAVLQRVQGGDFSPEGNLYLVSDADHDGLLPPSGVYGFEGDSLRLETFRPVASSPGWPAYHEIQGIEVRDFDGGPAPGVGGQLHVVLLDQELDDDIFFKHYQVASPGQLGFL